MGAAAMLGVGCSDPESAETGGAASGASGAASGGAGGDSANTGSANTGSANTGSAGAGGAGKGGSSNVGGGAGIGCDGPGLVWKTAHKTWYESYPDPNSAECIEYNGCTWEGLFAACDTKRPESWVADRNIVAAFPDYPSLMLHDLCLRKGTETIVVTVLDTCADSDCSGCCTQNQGAEEQLIDLESYTNERWGVPDGQIEWADLGPTQGDGCD